MISSDIEKVIEMLVGKFGTSPRYLIPQIVSYGKTRSLFCLVISLLGAVSIASVYHYASKKRGKIMDCNDAVILFGFYVPLSCCVTAMIMSLYDFIMWCNCPVTQAIKYAASFLK